MKSDYLESNLMSITEVLPLVESLPHNDKFRLMQFLVSALAVEEDIRLETWDTATATPVGRVYYSGRSDNAKRVRELLFAERRQAIQLRK